MKTNTTIYQKRLSHDRLSRRNRSENLPSRQTHNPLEPLIRGVTPHPRPPAITHGLDWLAYTVPGHIPLEQAYLPHNALELTGEVLSNIRGYDTRLALTHGSVSYHTRYPHHKRHVFFSGRDLAALWAAGVHPDDLLAYALEITAKITRLDFAVDYHGPSSPRDLHDAWEAKTLTTPVRQCTFTQSSDRTKGELNKAYTTYLGNKTSPRRLRVYDKAAEQGVEGPWTRIELVSRKDSACRLTRSMVNSGIAAAGKQAIRDFVRCDIDWFNEALVGDSVYIEPGQRRERNTKRWLLEKVLSPFIREIQEGAIVGDTEVRDAFQQAINEVT